MIPVLRARTKIKKDPMPFAEYARLLGIIFDELEEKANHIYSVTTCLRDKAHGSSCRLVYSVFTTILDYSYHHDVEWQSRAGNLSPYFFFDPPVSRRNDAWFLQVSRAGVPHCPGRNADTCEVTWVMAGSKIISVSAC